MSHYEFIIYCFCSLPMSSCIIWLIIVVLNSIIYELYWIHALLNIYVILASFSFFWSLWVFMNLSYFIQLPSLRYLLDKYLIKLLLAIYIWKFINNYEIHYNLRCLIEVLTFSLICRVRKAKCSCLLLFCGFTSTHPSICS